MKRKYFIALSLMVFVSSILGGQKYLMKKFSHHSNEIIKPIHRSLNTDMINIAVYEEDEFIVKLAFSTDEQRVIQNQSSSVITIQTQNTSSQPVNVSADTVIDLTTDSAGGTFSLTSSPFTPITQVTIPNGQSSVDLYYMDTNLGTFTLTASENVDQKWTDGTQQITIIPFVSTFRVEADNANQLAGEDFTVTVTALDGAGDVVTTYNGTVDLSETYVDPSTGTKSLTATTVTLTSGVGSITNETYDDCGTITIEAVDQIDTDFTGTSDQIKFFPYDFEVVIGDTEFTASSAGLRHIVNKELPVDITARNKSAGACLNYFGPATLSFVNEDPSDDQGASVTPSALTSDLWVSGVVELTDLLYDRWGSVTFVVADDTLVDQKGESEEVLFLPKTFTLFFTAPPSSRSFYYVDEPFDVTVTAIDENDTAVSNYAGTVTVVADGFNFPSEYSYTSGESGIHVFEDIASPKAVVDAIVIVNDTANKEVIANAAPITVKDASIKAYPNSGPVGDLSILIAVVDENGDIIEEDNSTNVIVELKEAIVDGSAKSKATDQFVTLSQGKANIIIHNDQGEVVTVVPKSSPSLKSISGEAVFGTVARKGLGVQMYREIR